MRKLLFIALLAVLVAMPLSVSAHNETVNSVSVHFTVEDIPTMKEEPAVFKLYNQEGTNLLDTQNYEIVKGQKWFDIKFNVPEYEIGTKFKFVIDSGAQGAFHSEVFAKEHILETYSMPDESGNDVFYTSFYMQLKPIWNKEAVIKIPGNKKTLFYHCLTENEVYVTTDLLSALGINTVTDFEGEKPSFTLVTDDGAYSAQFFLNDVHAVIGGESINLDIPTFEIGGLPYVPLSKVATYFACNYNLVSDNEYAREISLTPSVYSENYKKAGYVNGIDIESKTDYLVWVSKKDFSVNVYLGNNKNWRLVDSFPCSIGAPNSPTVEGQFEYHQYQPKWTYDKYYCGPVMRFYNGYAFHSYLIKYDGTPYDSRLGMRISAGCVRMHPDDIKWMVDFIPMYTKILVTP